MVRHLFGSISRFSPVAALTVASLGLVRRDAHAVHVDDAGLDAIPLLRKAVSDGTAVAVVDDDDALLLGEICPGGVLASCEVESASAAFAALPVGDVMTYVDCSMTHAPPESLLRAVRAQLKDAGLDAMAELMDTCRDDAASPPLSQSSSDEDAPLGRAHRPTRRLSTSGSFGWRSTDDVVACHSGSSLVAIMTQALTHRVGYVWVVEEDSGALFGVVRFADVLAVLREHIRPSQVLCCF